MSLIRNRVVWFLVGIDVLLAAAECFYQSTSRLGVSREAGILAVVGMGVVLVPVGVFQAVVFLVIRKTRLSTRAKFLSCLLPVILGGFLFCHTSVFHRNPKMLSPTKRYTAEISVDERVWHVLFTDRETGAQYEGTTDFLAWLNVYWQWDNQDRLWAYNSDDGRIWYWMHDGSRWVQTAYGSDDDRERSWIHDGSRWVETAHGGSDAPRDLAVKPPAGLLPDYAK